MHKGRLLSFWSKITIVNKKAKLIMIKEDEDTHRIFEEIGIDEFVQGPLTFEMFRDIVHE